MGAGATVGIATFLFGYSVFYYGLTQLQGGNWGYWDLTLPGRWPAKADVPRDSATTAQQQLAQIPFGLGQQLWQQYLRSLPKRGHGR